MAGESQQQLRLNIISLVAALLWGEDITVA